jgi:hypothetical protein
LIGNLDARGANVRALAERPECEALLWYACFGSGPELSLELSPDVLAGAARLGVALSVSVYEVSGGRDPSPA